MAFATTRWSLVVAAGDDAPAALADLIRIYWYPLYAFVRRGGVRPEEAQDLVQGFFAALIEKHYLESADRTRGGFAPSSSRRSSAMCPRSARRRGRRSAAADVLTSPRLRDGRGALPAGTAGCGDPGAALRAPLGPGPARAGPDGNRAGLRRPRRVGAVSRAPPLPRDPSPAPSREDAATRQGMTAVAFRVALHRLRRRYRDALTAEIPPRSKTRPRWTTRSASS